MTAKLRIPTPLRSFAGGKGEVPLEGPTVRSALALVGATHAGLVERVLDETGEVRSFVNLFVGSKDLRQLEGLDTPLAAGDVVSIVPAVAGGLG